MIKKSEESEKEYFYRPTNSRVKFFNDDNDDTLLNVDNVDMAYIMMKKIYKDDF